jgi:hypothetical protein
MKKIEYVNGIISSISKNDLSFFLWTFSFLLSANFLNDSYSLAFSSDSVLQLRARTADYDFAKCVLL